MPKVWLMSLLFYSTFAFAQDSECRQRYYLGLGIHRGFVWAHLDDMAYVANTNVTGIEFELYRKSTAPYYVKNTYQSGVGFTYYNMNNAVIGNNSYNAWYFIEPNLLYTKKLELGLRASVGLNYSENPYDSRTNPANLSYSLHYNAYVALSLFAQFELTHHSKIGLRLNFPHISNGAISSPNHGINFPTLSAAYYYRLSPANSEDLSRPFPIPQHLAHKWRFDAGAFVSAQNIPNKKDEIFLVNGLSLSASYKLTNLHALLVSTEWINDRASEEILKQQLRDSLSQHRFGFALGHEFRFRRFTFAQVAGIYYFNENPNLDWVYHRYVLNYKLSPWLALGIGFLANANKANFPDFRITYSLYQ